MKEREAPPCNKAVLRIRIDAVQEQSISTTTCSCIPSRKGCFQRSFPASAEEKRGVDAHGLDACPGSTGRAKVGIYTYQKNGETRRINEIKRFYPKETRDSRARPIRQVSSDGIKAYQKRQEKAFSPSGEGIQKTLLVLPTVPCESGEAAHG